MIKPSCMFTVYYNVSRHFPYNYQVLNFTIHYLTLFHPSIHFQTSTALLLKELLLMLNVLKKTNVSYKVTEKLGFCKRIYVNITDLLYCGYLVFQD